MFGGRPAKLLKNQAGMDDSASDFAGADHKKWNNRPIMETVK